MIRTLMASSAILALVIAGAVTAKAEDTAKPAATSTVVSTSTSIQRGAAAIRAMVSPGETTTPVTRRTKESGCAAVGEGS